MTNTWADIKNTNLVIIMGGNAAEAHPCGFKWVTEAKHHNKAKLIVVDPRFTRSAAMADLFMQLRPGTDIAWLGGVIWDRTGSYDLMWVIAILAGAFAAVVNLPVQDPRVPVPARAG